MKGFKTSIPKLAVWTVKLDEVTGQNLVTKRVVNNSDAANFNIFDYPNGGGAAIPAAILTAFKLGFKVLTDHFDGIYVVCSRSTLGFLRDFPVLLLSRVGKRVIVHVHGSDLPHLLERRGLGPIARWVYRNCDIIVPSNHLLPLLKRQQFHSIIVCENFAELSDNQIESCNEDIKKCDDLVVLWNSNIMASKGIIELVGGMEILKKEGITLKLIVLGQTLSDAECTKIEMQEFLTTLEKHDWIEVVGAVKPEKVSKYMAQSDVVALPSTYVSECQPLAIIQAMLAGCDLVITDTPALHATVDTYPAIFVERNPESIASAIRSFLADQNQSSTVSNVDIDKARSRFEPSAFDKRICGILQI